MSDGPDRAHAGLTVFAALTAGAVLIERRTGLLALTRLEPAWEPATWITAAVPVAALLVLLRPSSLPRLLALSAAFLATLVTWLPRGANHEMFLGIVHLTILVGAVSLGRGATPTRLYERIAPVLRWELVALYFWATLHKVNTGFFDPDRSCVTMQLYKLQGQVGMEVAVPEAVLPPLIVGTLVLEAAIPLGLAWRPTRRPMLLIAAAFHLLLGLNYPGFTAFLLGAFSLFVPPSALAALTARRRHDGLRTLALDLVVVVVVGLGVRLLLGPDPGLELPWNHRLHYAVWALGVCAAATVPLRAAWPVVTGRALMRVPQPAFWVLPAAVWLHGAAPHLGLKNTQSLAMFSNLSVEGGETNHLWIPAWVRVDGHLDDLVEIHGSSDPVLALYARQTPGHNWNNTFVVQPDPFLRLERPPRKAWTFLLPAHMVELRLHELAAEGTTGVWVDLTHDGRRRRLEDAEADPEWSQPTWLERTLLYSRGVPVQQRGLCMW